MNAAHGVMVGLVDLANFAGVGLSLGVHHWCSGSNSGSAFSLSVSGFLAVATLLIRIEVIASIIAVVVVLVITVVAATVVEVPVELLSLP